MNRVTDYDVKSKINDLVSKLGYEGAAQVISSESVDNLEYVYIAGDLYLKYVEEVCLDERELLIQYKYRFTSEWYEFVTTNYETLSKWIDKSRSRGYKYSSIKDIASNYLIRDGTKILEDIQWMWMRVSVQVAMPNMEDVRDTYDLLSTRKMIHATPTCVNAGLRCNNEDQSQLESCFCISVGDSMDSISKTQRLFLMASKNNAGVGVDLGRIRHSQVANRGTTKGIPGLLSMWNTLVPYADQLGSRPGASTMFCPIHHKDILTFIRMKDKNSSVQATNLNYCVVIPDLFMKRVLENGKWSLFCPRDEKKLYVRMKGMDDRISTIVDRGLCLHDMHGIDFDNFYLECERAGIASDTVDASTLWNDICRLRCTVGNPFIMFKDNTNRKSNHSHIGTITQSNLCVRGDTLILTERGHLPIKDLDDLRQDVKIWNGEEWSIVRPTLTGTNQHLLTITFSNRSEVHCTDYHRFAIHTSNSKYKVVQAKDLKVGDKLIKCNYPIIDGNIACRYDGMTLYCSLEVRLKCLSDYLDRCGNVVRVDGYDTIQCTPMDDIKLLLQTLGCDAEHDGQYMIISTSDLITLYKLGLDTKRLVYEVPDRLEQKDNSSYITITSIMDEGEYTDTYCFTESKRSMGIFNGVILMNCQEILQYTYPDEIAASCDLATINVSAWYNHSSKSIDWEGIGRCTRLLTRNLNRVIDRTSGMLPSKYRGDDPAHIGRMRHRAIGIGTMGYASLLSLMEIEYDSYEAREIAAIIKACIYFHSIDESVSMSMIDGPCTSWYGSPLSHGILHHDMCIDECKMLDRRCQKIVETHQFNVPNGWEYLRERVRLGTRNSLTTCQMPNSTTSSILGVSPGHEPLFSILYATSNVNRTSMDVYDCFREVMMRYNLYDPILLARYLKMNKGSIDDIEDIYPHVDKAIIGKIRSIFMNGFSINKRKMLQMYTWMGMYVDQGQSLNIFYARPNVEYVSQLQIEAWRYGLKTLYYLHRTTTDKISLQSKKIDPIITDSDEEKQVCTMKEGCRWCE